MIVVDTNAIAYLYLPGEHTAKAESLMAGAEHDVDSRQVLDLVYDSKCSAYDREDVALAMTLGVPLVTMDAKVRKSFPECTMPLPRE